MNKKKKYDLLIVGAGLSGAMYAWKFRRTNPDAKILVLEKNVHIGGLCHTHSEKGIIVHDYGPHIFHTDKLDVWNFVNSICEFVPFINTPLANFRGEIYNLPFNMNTFAKLFGITEPDKAKAELDERAVYFGRTPENMEEMVLSKLGYDIYRKFFKYYTEKQWGVSCDKLPASIASRIPIRFTYDNNYFYDKYSGVPALGYSHFIEKLFEGCEIALNTDYLDDRDSYNNLAERVVYTGPLDAFFHYIHGYLDYRSVRFEHTFIDDTDDLQGVAVMNFTDEQPFTRRIEHKHFLRQSTSGTLVSYEYPVKYVKGRIAAYPIPTHENEVLAAKYKSEATTFANVEFVGRLAEYRYYDMDDIVEKFLK